MRFVSAAMFVSVVGCGPSHGAASASGDGGGTDDAGEDSDDATSFASSDDDADGGVDSSSTGAPDEPAPRLFAEGRSTCVAMPDLRCWGDNAAGQLGVPDATTLDEPVALPFAPTALAMSTMTGCLIDEGTVRCAGRNDGGLLVEGAATTLPTHVALTLEAPAIVELASGFAHRCGLREDATVVCWGDNTHGALGADTTSTGHPTLVPELTDAVSVSAGNDHGCAARRDGSVVCWGDGAYGQLGNPDTEHPLTLVEDLAGIAEVHVDGYSSCALHEDGHVSCWGRASEGQLGVPDDGLDTCQVIVPFACARTPVTLPVITTARAMDFGSGGGCALTDDGVQCWGSFARASGALGPEPSTIELPGDPLEVDVASEHACALTTDGVFCWGRGTEGQLGNGTRTSSDTPVRAL